MTLAFWHRCPECRLARYWGPDVGDACENCGHDPDAEWRRLMAEKQGGLREVGEAEQTPVRQGQQVRRHRSRKEIGEDAAGTIE